MSPVRTTGFQTTFGKSGHRAPHGSETPGLFSRGQSFVHLFISGQERRFSLAQPPGSHPYARKPVMITATISGYRSRRPTTQIKSPSEL
jgi:hypothetical protein